MRTPLTLILVMAGMLASAQFTGPGQCIEFNGGSKYVNVPTSASLNPTAAITVEAWIYATGWGVNAWTNTIVSKEDWASGSRGYVLRCGNSGRLSFNIGIGTGWSEVVTTTTVMNANQWHHVAGTFNGTQLKIFVDGTEVALTSVTAVMTASPYDLRIGESAYSSVSSRPFTGRIDEVRIWNTALTVNQLRENMCKPVTSTHSNYSNLKGYWKLDEGGASTITADSSGNLNHGTLTNAPVWALSGAPLGESSAFSYTSPFAAALDNPLDSIAVSAFSPVPTGVQLYRISGQPANLTLPPGYASTGFSDGYWGVRVFGNPNAAYTLDIKLKTWPASTGCMPAVIKRTDNSVVTWSVSNDYLNPQTLSVTLNATGKQEFMVYFGRNSVITYNGPTSVCQGDSIILTANSQPGYSFMWHKNNVPLAGDTNSSLVVKQSGDYYVVVTNSVNCSDTSSVKTIMVHPKPNVQIVPSGPLTFCQGGNVKLHVTGASTYLWSTISTLDTIMVSQSGKYMVWGADTNQCVDSASAVVTVHPLPVPVIMLSGQSLTTALPYATYQWYIGNMSIPNAVQQVYIPIQNGIYKVEVTDSNGCIGISQNYTLSNIGIESRDGIALSIAACPNPAQGMTRFICSVPKKGKCTFGLTDFTGRAIRTETLESEGGSVTVSFDASLLSPGIYFYYIEYQGKRITKKLTVYQP